ncbi:XRE family transcriptional regulator (plasmid) [Thiospirochaeta perfilievii]|uniref:XRE family transcriptional regulator n=1 Tax=Thiospirochaeta perfilievii TaxID=252967 RepID=A0A5C1QGE4_9SPIO|nr:helix-turn-helix transcriptional regulator [Thiospirochaeta perfilievii]QEN06428.1 XRE family transcriptional regulator [Thiospirochaeta perfilievii]
MAEFFEILKEHRKSNNIDRSVVEKLAHINYQTITKIENGDFKSVNASDLLAYFRVLGFKISAGKPRL